MDKQETVYGFVPARKGSQGLLNKNLRPLGGKPLVARAVESLSKVEQISNVILSTDHEEIAEAGRAAGAEAPFLRPPQLATSTSPTISAIQHALGFLQKRGDRIDRLVMVQPTSPFLTSQTIAAALRYTQEKDFSFLQSVCRVTEHPYWVRVPAGDRMYPFHPTFASLRRQNLPGLLILNGAINIYKTEVLENGTMPDFPAYFTIDRIEGIDIDDETDWKIACALEEAGIQPGRTDVQKQ